MPDAGTFIGPYEILRELGRGGMGVVYLARDRRLDRDVAIKAITEGMAMNAARLERFEREGKTLAQLSHPNIAGIYGIEEHEGGKYLVLEYVEGVSLGDRLEHGPLAVEEAVEIAIGIAAGLEAAHEVGIIHRDLKPDNIKITPEGVVKVLDFGLAKSTEPTSGSDLNLSNSPTMSVPRSPTIPGAIMGTAAYMSPEQARGRRVDKRTDIWSFGVVLYEMLTGASPFVGETASDSIGAVLHKGVDLARLPAGAPASVRRVLERCLERDKSLRYRDIGDVRLDLLTSGEATEAVTTTRNGSSLPLKAAFAAMCVLAAIAAAGWYLASGTEEEPTRPVRKFDLMQGTVEQPLDAERPRISPDGARVAFVRDNRVYVRDFSSFEARAISGTEGASALFWSPDSKWIGYTTANSIYKVALLGGGAIKIADAESDVGWDLGNGWTSDDRIIYREDDYIAQVAARGGTPTPFLMVDEATETDFHSPSVVPDSQVVLFIEHRRNGEFGLAAYDGAKRVVLTAGKNDLIDTPVYSPTGHVLFVRGYSPQDLWAMGFDPATMEVTSEPFLLLPNANQPSVSDDGTLVVHRGNASRTGQLVFAGLDGTVEPIGDPFDLATSPMLSPDGTKIVVSAGKPAKFDIWVLDLERGTRTRITFTEAMTFPIGWSPDSKELAIVTLAAGGDADKTTTSFYAADGSGRTRPDLDFGIMSLDAEWKVGVCVDKPMSPTAIFAAVSLDNPADRSRTIDLPSSLQSIAVLNPAGTLLAYVSRESGENQVYCTRFPDGVGKWQVSIRGGSDPIWSADGRALYFKDTAIDSKVHVVDVVTEPSVRFGMPKEALDPRALGLDLSGGVAITRDQQRFVTMKADLEEKESGSISVIENWYEEYRDR